ncbi:MAG TPA: hypothetical protein VEQ87_13875 [Burkholderiales bacterium]|nr:hypothetical protein [Burkholderiales bacterium]
MLDAMAIRGPRWLIIAALVTMAPDTPGVFELWEDDELVFVGSSRNSTLRIQLVHELLESGSDATHFSWEITFDPAARERELLAEFELEHHHPPRFNSRG